MMGGRAGRDGVAKGLAEEEEDKTRNENLQREGGDGGRRGSGFAAISNTEERRGGRT